MSACVRCCSILLIGSLVSGTALGQSVRDLSLRDVLEVALQRESLSGQVIRSPGYQASAWLAGLPSLGVSYLESDERDGIDETEISLNLPIKSGGRRQADTTLRGLSAEMQELSRVQRELYLSGLIREAIWSHQIASARSQFALEKQALLQQMERQQEDLLAANASSAYSLLLLQKEGLNTQIGAQGYAQEARQWQLRYRQITGLGSMPEDIEEAALAASGFQVGQHPQMRELEALYEQQRQLLIAGSDRAADWQLSLNAKNLSVGNYSEDQYGLAVEMPLSFIGIESQAHNSEWQSTATQYHQANERLSNQLYSHWQILSAESRMLAQKQSLLTRSGHISEEIAEQLAELVASNEISQDTALRRMLEAVDTRASARINQLLIGQNNAMLRQAAGIPL